MLAQELIEYFPSIKPRSHYPVNILAGIIWILITGAQWNAIPEGSFPPKSTCYYWYQKLFQNNDFNLAFNLIIQTSDTQTSDTQTKRNNFESYVDASFVRSKYINDFFGYGRRGKGSKLVLLLNKKSIPISFLLDSSRPHELKHVEELLNKVEKKFMPKKLIGDTAYDSDKHNKLLSSKYGIELIEPHRKNRVNFTQDGRALRRYKRRYLVEQFFSHLQNFRKLVVRYEKNQKISLVLCIWHLLVF